MHKASKIRQLKLKILEFLRTSFFYQYYKTLVGNAANFINDNPSQDIFVIGVTWTNGKTTTAQLVHHILNQTLSKAMLISTPHNKIWTEIIPHKKARSDLTTFDFYNMLSMARDNGCKVAVIEVSSNSLKRMQLEGIHFDAAILTNITQDHVEESTEFHNYLNEKKKLFKSVLRNSKQNKFWIFPKDDKIGRKWFDELSFDKKINFSINSSGVLKAKNIQRYINGTAFEFSYLGKEYSVKTPLVGTFNVYNILAALSLGFGIGLDPVKAISAVQSFPGVVGRMERFTYKWIHFFVDMAHSPDALDKTLQFTSSVKWTGKLIVVFGSPGNKDKAKRAQMWKIIERYSNIMIATDNEPNRENRLQILDDLTSEITHKKEWDNLFVIPERKFAIQFAIEIAKPEDIILIAGRTRHNKQKTNTGVKYWDDKEFILWKWE